MDNNNFKKLGFDEGKYQKAVAFLQEKGFPRVYVERDFYSHDGVEILILTTTHALPELFILSYNEENQVNGAVKKTHIAEKGIHEIKDLFTGEEATQEATNISEASMVAAASSCPPGYEWRTYDCRTVYEVEQICLIGCLATGRVTYNACIALCTVARQVCVADCFPIGGGIEV